MPALKKTSKEERYKRRIRAFQDKIESLEEELKETHKDANRYYGRMSRLDETLYYICSKLGVLRARGVKWDNRIEGHEETIVAPWRTIEEARDWAREKLARL